MSIEVQGTCDERFAPIREAFVQNFDEGLEIGACVAVTRQGRSVVDLWAGHADLARSRPWQEDTLVQVFSTSKLMVVLCVLKLVGEAKIDLDAPIADYWAEFGQRRKSGITVRQVLIHRSGVPGFSEVQDNSTIGDWDHLIRDLERQAPWFEPGADGCYQFYTFGVLLG